jgi:hypothetical protein
MKRRTGRALLLRPLTLHPSPSQPSLSFFPNFYDISGLIFDLYRVEGPSHRALRRLDVPYRRGLQRFALPP